MKKGNNKSLVDNPLESIGNLTGVNSVTGRRFSKEAIENHEAEKEKASKTLEDIEDYVKEDITKQNSLTDKESKTLGSVIKRIKKEAQEEEIENEDIEDIEENITSYEEAFKEVETKQASLNANNEENKALYIKKTYIIHKDYIDLIEGLSLYSGKEKKEIVEELLKKATDLIDPSIKEKALKEVKKKKNKEDKDTKEIF